MLCTFLAVQEAEAAISNRIGFVVKKKELISYIKAINQIVENIQRVQIGTYFTGGTKQWYCKFRNMGVGGRVGGG